MCLLGHNSVYKCNIYIISSVARYTQCEAKRDIPFGYVAKMIPL